MGLEEEEGAAGGAEVGGVGGAVVGVEVEEVREVVCRGGGLASVLPRCLLAGKPSGGEKEGTWKRTLEYIHCEVEIVELDG